MAHKLDHADYRVAWICPLEVEQIAAMEMLDEEHARLPQSSADHNVYSLGTIYGHNVVIAGLYQTGNCPAATVMTQMRITFPNLRFGLLVGIGGGVPQVTENGTIRLGHVVVSKPTGAHSGVIHYNHGKAKDGCFERTTALAPPPAILLNAAQALAVRRARAGPDNDPVQNNMARIDTGRQHMKRFRFPGVENDRLYYPHHAHKGLGLSCEEGGCDSSQRIHRAEDDTALAVVHRGTIASGELVMKNAMLRDELARQHKVLCFEMEAAGALADFPCMVVRGISNYCDSHKNDQWNGYAAAVAAAYTRELFFHMPIEDMPRNDVDTVISMPTTYTLVPSVLGVTRVNHFVARDKELAQMREALSLTDERHTVVLYGLGGIGKTQLVMAYVRQYRSNYSAVIWINAKDEYSLGQSFEKAAQRILREYPSVTYISSAVKNRELNAIVEAVKRWLDEPKNDRWLVVYDNYDDVKLQARVEVHNTVNLLVEDDMLGETRQAQSWTNGTLSKAYDIRAYLPEADHGAVVITTRSSEVRLGECIPLSRLKNVNDGLAIMSSTSNRPDLNQDLHAFKLAQKLDGLPLALSTAGAYLDQRSTAWTCQDYLRQYEESWLRLQISSPQLVSYDRALYSTWDVSYRYILQQNPNSAVLLQLWAYFDNEDLWYELLLEGGADGPMWLQEVAGDRLKFDDAMRVLCQHGLAEVNPPRQDLGEESQGYSVHGCVHSWMIHVLNSEANDEMRLAAILCVAYHMPDRSDRDYRRLQRRLLKHANRCNEWMKSLSQTEMIPASEDEAWLYVWFGAFFADQDRLQDAEVVYERALQGYDKILGPRHTTSLDTADVLSNLYRSNGRLKDAEAMSKRALQGFEETYGPDHESTISAISNLALIYKAQGEYRDAEAMYKRSLHVLENTWGPDDSRTLSTVTYLGNLYRAQGQLEDAEAMYKRAFEWHEKASEPDSILACETMTSLGNLYVDRGRTVDAEKMFKRALDVDERVRGPDTLLRFVLLDRMGSLYLDAGKLKNAEAVYRQSLQGKEEMLGTIHISTLHTVRKIGDLYLGQDRTQDAEAMYNRALEGFEKSLGPDHTSTTDTVRRLAELYMIQGRLQDTKIILKRFAESCEQTKGPDHISTLELVNNLGLLYAYQNRPEAAEAMFIRALQGCKRSQGPDHESTREIIGNLCLLYMNCDRVFDAEAACKRALEECEEAVGRNHASTLELMRDMGNLYVYQNRVRDAEAVYKQALDRYQAAQSPGRLSILTLANDLGFAYADHRRFNDAESLYEFALQGYETLLGEDDESTLVTVINLGDLYSKQRRFSNAEAMYKRAFQAYKNRVGPEDALTIAAADRLSSLYKENTDASIMRAVRNLGSFYSGLKGRKPYGLRITSSLLQPFRRQVGATLMGERRARRGLRAKWEMLREKQKDRRKIWRAFRP